LLFIAESTHPDLCCRRSSETQKTMAKASVR
jgi:hypothetical protein